LVLNQIKEEETPMSMHYGAPV